MGKEKIYDDGIRLKKDIAFERKKRIIIDLLRLYCGNKWNVYFSNRCFLT